jgi:SAM-dependent methyltransferase
MAGAKAAYQRDVEMYLGEINLFRERKCPGCGGLNSEFFCKKDGFNFVRCPGCWTVFMNPGPSSKLVHKLYQTSNTYDYWGKHVYPASADGRFLKLTVPRANYVMNARSGSASDLSLKILEIGAGTGETVKYISKQHPNSQCFAAEPNPSMWSYYEKSGITLFKDSLENLESKEFDFDIIFAFEVIEHFLDPSKLFEKAAKLLKKGGLLILSTPNAQSLEVLGLREESITLDIEHISILTPSAVHVLAQKYGFSVRLIETPGKFDLELLSSKFRRRLLKVFLRSELNSTTAQEFLARFGFSSHMKLVLEK